MNSITQRVFTASQAALALEQLIESTEADGGLVGVELEGQIDWLASQSNDLKPAIDDLLAISSEIEHRAAGRKAESKRLLELSKRDSQIADWMKGQIARVLEASATTTIQTARHRVTLVNPGGVRALEITGDVPEAFTTKVITIVPNKELIRATLEAGQPLAFAMLHSKQKVLKVS
jgi:hypothetical protein